MIDNEIFNIEIGISEYTYRIYRYTYFLNYKYKI
jgi:hypothetical protein